MFRKTATLIFTSLILTGLLSGAEPSICIDLKEPVYEGGVLRTTQGGVIQGEGIRVQAQEITYSKSESACTLSASTNLIMQFGEYYFIADSLEYDFISQQGVLTNATTAVEPWFFGGETVYLNSDGSITLFNGFITTSETDERDWELQCDAAVLEEKRYLKAFDLKMRILDVPVFWLPCLQTDLESIFDSPVRYNLKWGGSQGVRASMVYEVFNWNRFKTFLRLDYRIKRGPGGGIETYYLSEDHREEFNTINYAAMDNSVSNPHETLRYRFQGLYRNLVYDDSIAVHLSWDKLSDRDMATDYNDRGLELDIAGRTQLLIRKQEETRIERFVSRLKVNQFQSVKQQLPTIELSWKPKLLGYTGIYSDTFFRASYLDFSYSNDTIDVHDYNSTRVELNQEFYRPMPFRYFTLTPEAGTEMIFYGNSPEGNARFLALFYGGAEAKMAFSKVMGCTKHVFEPYAKFIYYTSPTVSPHNHYIFDIDDGWYQANTLKVGCSNQIFRKTECCLSRPLLVDLYTYGFFDTPTIGKLFPEVYADVSYLASDTVRHTVEFAWDLQHGKLYHFNARTEWTAAKDLAIRGEYRHRSEYDWRKADHTNFILDAFRSEKSLLHSTLSDRRDTLIAAFFYQFNPNWGCEFEARQGWNRRCEPSYTEFELDLLGTLRSAINVKFSYQHKEGDDRVAFYFTIGLNKPNLKKSDCWLPCLEW
ncbi:MAG: hypothetical protein ACK5MA_06775 [Parachlamydiaceae bacterium]